jgi:hypothetical protein
MRKFGLTHHPMRIIIVDEDLVDARRNSLSAPTPLRIPCGSISTSRSFSPTAASQVDSSRGFSNTTLLIGYADCFGHIPVELRLVVDPAGQASD